MKNQLPAVGIIDVGPASWGSVQFLAGGLKMAAPGSGMSFDVTSAARECRKHKAALACAPAVVVTGLLAGLLRRI